MSSLAKVFEIIFMEAQDMLQKVDSVFWILYYDRGVVVVAVGRGRVRGVGNILEGG